MGVALLFGPEANIPAAVEQFRAASDMDHPRAKAMVAYYMLRPANTGGVNEEGCARLLQEAASTGDPFVVALWSWWRCAHVGEVEYNRVRPTVAARVARALTALRGMVVEPSHADSLLCAWALGVTLDVVREEYHEAVRWYRIAADQGLAVAQCNLGVMYDDGLGVQQDHIEAARWYRILPRHSAT